MNRKLIFLNLALVALAGAAAVQLRSRWVADHARAAVELHPRVAPIAAPPFTPALAPTAVLPSNYNNVAQKDLFDPSRNPDVPVELPPAPPPPPPPPPMPPLPLYHGSMNLGDGPVAIMSVTAAAKHEAIKPGEMIGPFKLIDITRDDLTLEWNGQLIRKQLYELQSRSLPASQPVNTASTEPGMVAAEASGAAVREGSGEATTFGFKTMPAQRHGSYGTVKDGYKKVSIPTPFGNACIWDPVGK